MNQDQRRPTVADIVAGVTVAFIAIPQSLAYAEIAGLPPHLGLYAVAFPALLAAFFASSRYLQTGPVATTSLLVFGALTPLADVGTPAYVRLAALLALLVGMVRLLLGVLRLGGISDFMSQPVLLGFSTAAAVLIMSSQSAKVFGAADVAGSLISKLVHVLSSPSEWDLPTMALSVGAALVIIGGRKLHPLFPGVLAVAVGGILLGRFTDLPFALVGQVPAGLPSAAWAIDWAAAPGLLVSAAVIALLGFAEPVAIARTFAAQDRERWDANRELISQGVANIASGLSGGFPVGGSFARSSVNRMAGAKTRWAGAVTGLTVIAFLPFAGLLSTLPQAVLGTIVIVAISKFLRVGAMLRIAKVSLPQAAIAWITAIATLALAPRVDLAIVIGVGCALAVHVLREAGGVTVHSSYANGDLTLAPKGVLFFASASRFRDELLVGLAAHQDATMLTLDLSQLGRVDYSGAAALSEVMEEARSAGLEARVTNTPARVEKLLSAFRD